MASAITPVIVAANAGKPPAGTLGLYSVTLAIGAGNYAAGGLALKTALETVLAAVTAANPGYVDRGVTIQNAFVKGISGYEYEYVKSTGKLIVRFADYDAGADGPLIEIPTAATPAGVVADVINALLFVTWAS